MLGSPVADPEAWQGPSHSNIEVGRVVVKTAICGSHMWLVRLCNKDSRKARESCAQMKIAFAAGPLTAGAIRGSVLGQLQH